MRNKLVKKIKPVLTAAIITSMVVPSAFVYAATDEGDSYSSYFDSDSFACGATYETAPQLIENLKILDNKLQGSGNGDVSIEKNIYGSGLMPSVGNINALTVMVEFADDKFNDDITKEYVNKLMYGAEDESAEAYPFESVSAFYNRSSYGKLNIQGDVRKISLEGTRDSYTSALNANGEKNYRNDVWNALDKMDIDWSKYDSNGDKYIDSLVFIVSGKSDRDGGQWWNHTLKGDSAVLCGEYKVGNYAEIMEWYASDGLASTAIHQIGHCLGLPDQCRYDKELEIYSVTNGINDNDMMASSNSDINALCKMMLGWIDADKVKLVKYGSDMQNVSLNKYADDGSCAVMFLDNSSSLFGEYYLAEYVTSDKNMKYLLLDQNGEVKFYHVNSKLNSNGTFAHDNVGNKGNRLIKAVDKDENVYHVNDWIPVSRNKNLAVLTHWYGNENACGFVSGDEFTPYTAPSTGKYASENIKNSPLEFSGLNVKNINTNDSSAGMDIYFEKSPSGEYALKAVFAEDINCYNCKLLDISVDFNRDIAIKDNSIKAYLRKAVDNIRIADVNIDTESSYSTGLEYTGHSALRVTVNDSLDTSTDYELVFPSGMFVTSYGKVSEEIILSGIRTADLNINATETKEFNIDKEKYVDIIEAYHKKDGNIEIACKGKDMSINICEIEPVTGKLVGEYKLYKSDSNEDFNRCYFDKTEDGRYIVLSDIDNTDNDFYRLYVFDSDKNLITSYDTTCSRVENIVNDRVIMSDRSDNEFIFDARNMTLDKINYKSSIGDRYTYSILGFDNYIITEKGYEYNYQIWDLDGNLVRTFDFGKDELKINDFRPADNGYRIICESKNENNIYILELTADFTLKNKTLMFSGKYPKLYVLDSDNGYIVSYSKPIRKEIDIFQDYSSIIDEDYNEWKMGTNEIGMNDIQGSIEHKVNGQECILTGNMFSDHNDRYGYYTKLIYQISDPYNIKSKGDKKVNQIKVSSDVKTDKTGNIVLNAADERGYISKINPVADEKYTIESFSDRKYLCVSNGDNTAWIYYPMEIKGSDESTTCINKINRLNENSTARQVNSAGKSFYRLNSSDQYAVSDEAIIKAEKYMLEKNTDLNVDMEYDSDCNVKVYGAAICAGLFDAESEEDGTISGKVKVKVDEVKSDNEIFNLGIRLDVNGLINCEQYSQMPVYVEIPNGISAESIANKEYSLVHIDDTNGNMAKKIDYDLSSDGKSIVFRTEKYSKGRYIMMDSQLAKDLNCALYLSYSDNAPLNLYVAGYDSNGKMLSVTEKAVKQGDILPFKPENGVTYKAYGLDEACNIRAENGIPICNIK